MRSLNKYYLFIIFLFINYVLFAQIDDPGGPPDGVPLDGGLLSVLLGSGAAYLGLKIRKKFKQKE